MNLTTTLLSVLHHNDSTKPLSRLTLAEYAQAEVNVYSALCTATISTGLCPVYRNRIPLPNNTDKEGSKTNRDLWIKYMSRVLSTEDVGPIHQKLLSEQIVGANYSQAISHKLKAVNNTNKTGVTLNYQEDSGVSFSVSEVSTVNAFKESMAPVKTHETLTNLYFNSVAAAYLGLTLEDTNVIPMDSELVPAFCRESSGVIGQRFVSRNLEKTISFVPLPWLSGVSLDGWDWVMVDDESKVPPTGDLILYSLSHTTFETLAYLNSEEYSEDLEI